MSRLLYKKKDKELYAIYSTIIDDYITDFLPMGKIREIWLKDLIKEANEKVNNYMRIYDECYTTGSRDSAFLKDLANSLMGISTVLEVYVEQKGIHPNYALEKLNNSRSYIDACIKYFESKGEKE